MGAASVCRGANWPFGSCVLGPAGRGPRYRGFGPRRVRAGRLAFLAASSRSCADLQRARASRPKLASSTAFLVAAVLEDLGAEAVPLWFMNPIVALWWAHSCRRRQMNARRSGTGPVGLRNSSKIYRSFTLPFLPRRRAAQHRDSWKSIPALKKCRPSAGIKRRCAISTA